MGHGLNRLMEHPQLLLGRRHILDRRMECQLVALLVHDQPPRSGQEAKHAVDPIHAPWLGGFQRSHEHLVQAQRIGSILGHHLIGIHHVSAALRHLESAALELNFRICLQDKTGTPFFGQFGCDAHRVHRPPRRFVRPLFLGVHVNVLGIAPRALVVLPAGQLDFPQDHALVDQFLERLGRTDPAPIKKDLVPEAGVKQV